MIEINPERLEEYLKEAFGIETKLVDYGEIGSLDKQGMKSFGYGKPLLVVYEIKGQKNEAVLSVMKGDNFGHQFYWDRASVLLFQYETSARMKRHVKPVGLGYINRTGRMVPMNSPEEFFIMNEKLEGYDYFHDLDRIMKSGITDKDLETAKDMAGWLAEVHSEKKDDPHLYKRRIRELLGSSECIMGIVDEAFPDDWDFFSCSDFKRLEKRLIDWRWKLMKYYSHRLCAVHGDFHPWNVLIGGKNGFSVLDRSRGEWGEAAGDVCTMAVNYLLFGLYGGSDLSPDFKKIYLAFMEEYFCRTGDMEALEVMAPFIVFRGLVIASPVWYPDHPDEVRKALLNLVVNVLEDEVFDYAGIEKYMR